MKVNSWRTRNLDNKYQPPWWDTACDEANLKHTVYCVNLEQLILLMLLHCIKLNVIALKVYVNWKKKEFQWKRRSALIDARGNPKSFRQTVTNNNVSKSENDNSLSSDDLIEHFETLFRQPETEANHCDEYRLRNITQENNIDTLERPTSEQEITESVYKIWSQTGQVVRMAYAQKCSKLQLILLCHICIRFSIISMSMAYFHNIGAVAWFHLFIKPDLQINLNITAQ